MRFLLGLIAGAGVVLLIAAAAGDPGWRDRAGAALQTLQARAVDIWHRAAAEVAPTEPNDTDEAEKVVVAAAPPQPPGEPDAAAPAVPEQPAEPALTAAEPPAADPASPPDAAVDEAPQPSAVPIPRPPDPEPVDRPQALSGVQRIWVPFHSEMSANGFAARLSRSLDHPFRVERRGPRSYQVVFRYRSEPERQALLAQAADATGLPL
ncbi:MAG TPA: hypothetical protein VF210_11010 [Pseudomonadales bacterium]